MHRNPSFQLRSVEPAALETVAAGTCVTGGTVPSTSFTVGHASPAPVCFDAAACVMLVCAWSATRHAFTRSTVLYRLSEELTTAVCTTASTSSLDDREQHLPMLFATAPGRTALQGHQLKHRPLNQQGLWLQCTPTTEGRRRADASSARSRAWTGTAQAAQSGA